MSASKEFTSFEDYQHPEYIAACGPQAATVSGGGGAAAPAAPQTLEQSASAKAVKTIFEQHQCLNCHTPEKAGPAGTDFDSILDRDKLVALKMFNFDLPAKSKLYTFVKNGSMPAQDDTLNPNPKLLSDDEKAALLQWITLKAPNFAGSGGAAAPAAVVAFISEPDKIFACKKTSMASTSARGHSHAI